MSTTANTIRSGTRIPNTNATAYLTVTNSNTNTRANTSRTRPASRGGIAGDGIERMASDGEQPETP
jgi:hypothetical protein